MTKVLAAAARLQAAEQSQVDTRKVEAALARLTPVRVRVPRSLVSNQPAEDAGRRHYVRQVGYTRSTYTNPSFFH